MRDCYSTWNDKRITNCMKEKYHAESVEKHDFKIHSFFSHVKLAKLC